MDAAFWDSSALVPLCVQQPASQVARGMAGNYRIVVWWATPVEMQSAFTRLLRMSQISTADYGAAQAALVSLRRSWSEMQPSELLRAHAEALLQRFPLKAADSLQLAAALVWCDGRTVGRVFVSGDAQLISAARVMGFQAIES